MVGPTRHTDQGDSIMMEAILLIAVGALLVIAYQNFDSAGRLCDSIIRRSDEIIRTLKSVKRDLKPKKRRK
jgi:hypothetical protein